MSLDTNAQATRLASHTTTMADEYAKRGLDWEEQLQQRARELNLMRTLGLTTDTAAPPSPPSNPPPSDNEPTVPSNPDDGDDTE